MRTITYLLTRQRFYGKRLIGHCLAYCFSFLRWLYFIPPSHPTIILRDFPLWNLCYSNSPLVCTSSSLVASGFEASLLAENMKIGMEVYFGMLFHILRGGACSDHLVAAKCSILDENLLQIAKSQKVFEGFWWNLTWNILLGRRILLQNSKLLQQPEGLLQLAANF